MSAKAIIIKGLTREGRPFRPSDWAQRLATAVGRAGPDRRVEFHPRIRMATLHGVHCIVVHENLREEEPMLFDFLMEFAKSNELQIEEVEGYLPGGDEPRG